MTNAFYVPAERAISGRIMPLLSIATSRAFRSGSNRQSFTPRLVSLLLAITVSVHNNLLTSPCQAILVDKMRLGRCRASKCTKRMRCAHDLRPLYDRSAMATFKAPSGIPLHRKRPTTAAAAEVSQSQLISPEVEYIPCIILFVYVNFVLST